MRILCTKYLYKQFTKTRFCEIILAVNKGDLTIYG